MVIKMIDDVSYPRINVQLGIRLYADEQIHAFHRMEDDSERWHIILAKDFIYHQTPEGKALTPCKGIVLLPTPLGLSNLICTEKARGYMLSIPYTTAMKISITDDTVLLASALNEPYSQLGSNDAEYVEKLFFLIRHAMDGDGPYAENELICLCQALVAVCKKYYRTSTSGDVSVKQGNIAMNFIKLVMNHSDSKRNLEYYAHELDLTPKYLSRLISKATGKTAGKWIEEQTIKSAKQMLRTSDLTVTSISERLSFNSASEFSRYFKRATSQTPFEYRKSLVRSRF